ncbi:hypothetical protein [Acrocarpospora catenulata]|uniref:hypothetical protein n=1 Tax=Acrocarpospora catenulata TaxID=2836182 RepID=UPI001BDA1F4F|nr:hypothetical protein [Acrocarpospora catenulata]
MKACKANAELLGRPALADHGNGIIAVGEAEVLQPGQAPDFTLDGLTWLTQPFCRRTGTPGRGGPPGPARRRGTPEPDAPERS